MTGTLHITGDAAADELLSTDPLALLLGMLLDQQVAMEIAFSGPAKIRDRMGGEKSLSAQSIAEADPDAFATLCATPPAVHRFPGSMAARIQTVCRTIVADWDGDAAAIWTRPAPSTASAPDGKEVFGRLKALPGFGDQKARIFVALLGKQYGYDGAGWREAAGDYGEEGSHRSVADIVDEASLAQVRETKKAVKAAAKTARPAGGSR
ncbi:Fe-S cluster assembly protein HesB [Planctomonas sp. JC2975]|uniref:HhH-GPD-type base excision DNA repair protein n=1 Tax=Planctomonas sp. JC2975 TaxID=2729626 RepID=UPI0014734B2E|nr:HhH-GPD-type base excision DNA repair protein [Planctomonas sp. JC2975]NNC12148.1 Fe-S cluster assembly protein HesB [Planctomonas sp. JC2975]